MLGGQPVGVARLTVQQEGRVQGSHEHWGGPMKGGNGVSIDLRLTDSKRLRSSKYFFFSVLSKL